MRHSNSTSKKSSKNQNFLFALPQRDENVKKIIANNRSTKCAFHKVTTTLAQRKRGKYANARFELGVIKPCSGNQTSSFHEPAMNDFPFHVRQ